MARFGQSFLASLTQPSYGQGLFELGGAIGGAPAAAAEKKTEQERLARLDESFKKTVQGTAAAQQGDVSAVTQRMRELQQAMTLAKTAEEKQMYAQEIKSLQNLIPGARKTQLDNKAKAIYTTEKALESEQLDPAAKAALTQRLAEMKKDPEAVEKYNEYRLNEWRTGQLEKQMQNEAWLQSNGEAISKAIKEADLEKLDSLGEDAASQNMYEGFQTYVNTVTQNVKTRDFLEQRSIEKTNEPNLNYQDAIDALPKELKPMVQARYDSYKNVVDKGWNGTTWNEALRTRAKNLEKDLTDSLARAQDTVALNDFRQANSLMTSTREAIQRIELNLERPVDESEVRALALTIAKDPKKIKATEFKQARREIQRRNRESAINQIRLLDPAYAEEKYPESQKVSIEDKVAMARQNKMSDVSIRDNLRKEGYSEIEINSVMGEPSGGYMSSEHTSADRAYIEGVRSKISPMGTYSNG